MSMFLIWGTLMGTLVYLELVYHISCFGFGSYNPIYMLMLVTLWAAGETLIVGILKGRWKKIAYYFFIWFSLIWTAVQVVYLRIFKQPLLWEAAFRGGGDALTNYWREALEGIIGALPILLLIFMPGIAIGFLFHIKKWVFPDFALLQVLRTVVILVIGAAGCIVTLQIGKFTKQDFYEDYQEFFDPMTIAENMGMWTMLERDTVMGVGGMVQAVWNGMEQQVILASGEQAGGQSNAPDTDMTGSNEQDASSDGEAGAAENSVAEGEGMEAEQNGQSDGSDGESASSNTEIPGNSAESEEPTVHQFNINFDTLRGLADNNKQSWLADYIQELVPAAANEYTGMFEGYNLIYLTAEGFSTHAVREDLTPTLYRLINSGFVFENYYVPLWQTSTSDGEYINCTGLIPDGQFSMRKSAENEMAYTLPRFFEKEGVVSYAYHNNSLSYYDRHLTHPNLGYDFKGCKLGNLSEEEWGDKIFPMEHPGAWPASDLEMMQGTLPEYVNQDRFHVYYLTVSGHMNYNFKGNAMSSKNREAVAGLELSENARAYIACNIELDKALECLLTELEAAGQLEKTVICLSADHYPYAMTTEQYEELAGKSLSEGMDMYRNSIILWNAALEEEPIVIDKVCGSMDIIPTLLNLFGFEYDSRMYAGRDMLSDEEGMVIFNDRSFVTDGVIYKRKAKETIWLKDEEGNDIIPDDAKEAYLAEKKQEVKERYQFSAYILQENYYVDIEQAIEE